MARHLILDLSNNNPSANLARVRQAGFDGLWHKVSEGATFTDKFWPQRRDQGRYFGLRVGGYHFARFATVEGAKLEAHYFADRLGPLRRRDLAPVLDLETWATEDRLLMEQCARAWMHVVKDRLGTWPIFYSYPSFIQRLAVKRPIGRGLWLASYGRNDGTEQPYIVPIPFRRALAHQFTSQATVAGVTGVCDVSSAPRMRPLLAHPLLGL
jgi:lysozyme